MYAASEDYSSAESSMLAGCSSTYDIATWFEGAACIITHSSNGAIRQHKERGKLSNRCYGMSRKLLYARLRYLWNLQATSHECYIS